MMFIIVVTDTCLLGNVHTCHIQMKSFEVSEHCFHHWQDTLASVRLRGGVKLYQFFTWDLGRLRTVFFRFGGLPTPQ